MVRADEAAQDVREAERALKAAASAHATTLEELRVAHSDRTAALIRTCSVETELLQQTLSELQAHKVLVDQTAKLSTVQGKLGTAQRELNKETAAHTNDKKARTSEATKAAKEQAQLSKLLATTEAAGEKLKLQVAKFSKHTRAKAA